MGTAILGVNVKGTKLPTLKKTVVDMFLRTIKSLICFHIR